MIIPHFKQIGRLSSESFPNEAESISTSTSPPPTHTFTLPPPTNTTSPCSSISIGNFARSTKQVDWMVRNEFSSITISQINLGCPAVNDSLDKIFLGGPKIWDGSASPTSVSINSGWRGSSRIVGIGVSPTLRFTFISMAEGYGYKVSVRFSNECSVNKSN